MAPQVTCECGTCAKCKRRVYMRQWYAQNREKVGGWVKRYRDDHPDRLRAYENTRNQKFERIVASRKRKRGSDRSAQSRYAVNHPEEVRNSKAGWKDRNPEKVRAHALLAYYIRTGRITREPCEVCGDPRSEGHHADYSRVLEVRWLCRKHHAREHWLPDMSVS